MCAFCLHNLVLLFYHHCPQLFCFNSLISCQKKTKKNIVFLNSYQQLSRQSDTNFLVVTWQTFHNLKSACSVVGSTSRALLSWYQKLCWHILTHTGEQCKHSLCISVTLEEGGVFRKVILGVGPFEVVGSVPLPSPSSPSLPFPPLLFPPEIFLVIT